MTRTPLLASVFLTAVLASGVVSSCGDAGAPPGTSPTGTSPGGPSSSGTSTASTAAATTARAVTVTRSGGLLGGRTSYRFAKGAEPPRGYTAADVRAVLRAAGAPRLHHLQAPPPGNQCCDRYVFRLTVAWSDGTTRTFATVDGDHEPAPLAWLVRLAT